jgi:TonB family protein
MESFGLYLLKSAIWLTGFALVFLVILRNERYFRLNRVFLLSGIVASIVFPFYTWHYAVILPSLPEANISVSGLTAVAFAPEKIIIPIYWWFYLAGIALFVFRLTRQTWMVIRKLKKAGYVKNGPVKLVRTSEYASSFSFFSFVFVNPSTTDIEMKEIVIHEREHIQQHHWFDLVLVELLCMLQWFNPFVWIYSRLIRQNHEYLADEMALQSTSNPAIYHATLLNQMLGVPVIDLANSFSYSINKKRFKMMKKMTYSPFRKLKLLIVLPFMALVFYAFAKPEYITAPSENQITNIGQANEGKVVKGKVTRESDGKALSGTSVIIRGTTNGTMVDVDGNFKLENVSNNAEIVFSFVGLISKVMKPDFSKPMIVKMVVEDIGIEKVTVVGYAKDTPPPPPINLKEAISSKNPPLILLDGMETERKEMDEIKPDDIVSMNVIKDKKTIEKYGEKAKNGIIEITSKNPPLYLLDGIVIDPEKMNIKPEDIDHIDVLKGKSGFKEYGEKGKNGVVLITTKKNAKNADAGISKQKIGIIDSRDAKEQPLYFLDGALIDKSKMDAINPEDIQSISVLKEKGATDKYGEKGKNGVVLITSKKKGVEIRLTDGSQTKPSMYFVGGVEKTKDEFEKIDPNSIESVNVTKGDFAVKKYGEKARDGVIEVLLKMAPPPPPPPPAGQKNKKGVFVVVEEMPQFPGGEPALRKFIAQQIRYPAEAQKVNAQGKVFVNFVVNSNGKVDRAKVVRSIDPDLDAEAIRVVNSLPDWTPGRQRGEAVDVSYTIPISFSLQPSDDKAEVVRPQFPGGNAEMMKFISENLKYPKQAKKDKAEGKVIVAFKVLLTGKIENPQVVKSIHPALDAEALRIIKSMPDWNPGTVKGEGKDMGSMVPVEFVLQ